MRPDNLYTQLQQKKYDYLAEYDGNQKGWREGEPISFAVSILEAHNGHKDYEEYLWKDIPDKSTKSVLDFGCGPGRNLIHYYGKVKSIDGVDLSEGNLQLARTWMKTKGLDPNNFKLYKNDGVSLKEIPSESYDVVMSTICLQHISVYDIRYQLMKEFFRVLRPGGYVTVQMLLTSDKPGTVKYYDNFYEADDTNGAHDCLVENPDYVKKDLEEIGFINFHAYVRPSAELLGGKRGPTTDNDWVYINAQKPL